MTKLFTLAELQEHLLKEVLRADQTFNINQDLAWRSLNKEKDAPLYAGVKQLESLFLGELKFTFWLEPVKPSLFFRIKQFVLMRKRVFVLYRLMPHEGKGYVQVTLTIRRESFKKYITEITSQPHLNPESAHVFS